MARDGSGTYNRTQSDYVFDTVIEEAKINSELNDIASELTNSIAADGQTTITANLPMDNNKHTGVAAGTALTDYADVKSVQNGTYLWCGTAGGTKNALTLTPSPTVTALVAGQRFRFKAGSTASDDAVTVVVSGLSSVAAEINDAALSASVVIEANKYYDALYDGTAFQLTRLSQSASTALSNIVEDTTPQLGANLDPNGNGIAFPGATVTDVTGADTLLVSGTAGTNGNVAAWNSDGDIVDGSMSATPATQAEQETGTSITAAVTPGRQHFHPSAAKAFATFNGTGAIAKASEGNYNIGTLVDNGTGDYTVPFTTAMATANFPAVANGSPVNGTPSGDRFANVYGTAAANMKVFTANGGTATDFALVMAIAFGDQ